MKPEDTWISRRRSLALMGAGLLTAGGVTFGQGRAGKEPSKTILGTWPLGLQLWTLSEQLGKDLPGTLKKAKAAGYDVVESAGLAGHSAKDFRQMLDDAGLTCRGAHFSMGDLLEGVEPRIEVAKTLGARWLVCASPKLAHPVAPGQDWAVAMRDGMTADAWKMNAEGLAKMAPVIKRAGLQLAYHNHFMEFSDLGGVTGLGLLLAAADPSLLRLELDVGWVRVAGQDPTAILKAHADRVDLLHIKDVVADPSSSIGFRSVEVGQGVIQWSPLLNAAKDLRVKTLFVEQEAPYMRDIFTSLAMSRDYLHGVS